MARDWHELFKSWAKPPSETEETKGANAARMINDALREHAALKPRKFDVYATGSYRNNTNIRLGSDIDIAIVLADAVYSEYPASGPPTRESLGFTESTYGLKAFRDEVERALKAKFGADGVTWVQILICSGVSDSYPRSPEASHAAFLRFGLAS